MLRKLRQHAGREQGFTLIELLVVILIIGILAAIALPSFLGQRGKGQDASAKADARNAVTQMESCWTEAATYVGCPNANSPFSGSAAASAQSSAGYVVSTLSKSGATYTITKVGAAYTRACSPVGTGGCTTGSW